MRRGWPDHKTTEELIYGPGGLNEALQIPGVINTWTMPIKARVDMLSTGVRTSVGIKILGPDLGKIQELGEHIEMVLKDALDQECLPSGLWRLFPDFNLKRERWPATASVDEANMAVMCHWRRECNHHDRRSRAPHQRALSARLPQLGR